MGSFVAWEKTMAHDFNGVHFGKNSPGVGDVHISTALGNSNPGKGKKRRVVTTVGDGATVPPHGIDVTALAAVDFNHVHLEKGGAALPGDKNPYVIQPRKPDPAAATVGKPVVGGKKPNPRRTSWAATGYSPGSDTGNPPGMQKSDHVPQKFKEIHGIIVAIETKAGEKRKAKDDKGETHDVVYNYDYGRIQQAHGPDGDQLDVYLGDDKDSTRAFVINQVEADTGELSDVKIMLGFKKKKHAKRAFQETHFDGHGHQAIGDLIETTYPKLKEWITGPDTRKAFPKKFAKLAEDPERKLAPFARGMSRNVFPVHKHALSQIRPDQTPRLFEALTHPKKLDKRTMKFGTLTAIQDRVDPQKVEAIRAGEHAGKNRAIVVKFAGRNYIVDGDHHLAAQWLDGADKFKVRFLDISARTEAVTEKRAPAHKPGESHEWSTTFNVLKADEDQQLVFGWASVSEIGGQIVTDKQGDQIEPDELERAAYDYVLHARDMGHMHEEKGVGKLVESMMFTAEKQEALGIDLGMTAWWIGFFVENKKVFREIKSGALPELSIGGVAIPIEI